MPWASDEATRHACPVASWEERTAWNQGVPFPPAPRSSSSVEAKVGWGRRGDSGAEPRSTQALSAQQDRRPRGQPRCGHRPVDQHGDTGVSKQFLSFLDLILLEGTLRPERIACLVRSDGLRQVQTRPGPNGLGKPRITPSGRVRPPLSETRTVRVRCPPGGAGAAAD